METKFKKHIVLDILRIRSRYSTIYFQFIIFLCDVPTLKKIVSGGAPRW